MQCLYAQEVGNPLSFFCARRANMFLARLMENVSQSSLNFMMTIYWN
jgi:hypothetical protein